VHTEVTKRAPGATARRKASARGFSMTSHVPKPPGAKRTSTSRGQSANEHVGTTVTPESVRIGAVDSPAVVSR
jgi:hypothetical protein